MHNQLLNGGNSNIRQIEIKPNVPSVPQGMQPASQLQEHLVFALLLKLVEHHSPMVAQPAVDKKERKNN